MLIVTGIILSSKKKTMDKNLTPEQKHILFEEGTESPGTSQLNYVKKGKEAIIA